jgi:aspartyl-tRNA(Asn)/glutamyl-tRNA(Gln) amidotransferase subunit C
MKISPEETARVAALARLKLTPEQTEKLAGQLNDILEAMDKLNELDAADAPAATHALELTSALRPDQARPSLDREQGLANAPETDGQSFVVPRII